MALIGVLQLLLFAVAPLMVFRAGGGGGYRTINRSYRRYNNRRARRFKRISRKMVAQALETKYFPQADLATHTQGGTYRFGCNTTGALCRDGAVNIGAAYFCPFVFEDGGTVGHGMANGSSRWTMEGNKIWLRSVRMACYFLNPHTDSKVVRCTVFQYHDWAECDYDQSGDAYMNKATVPWGQTNGAAVTLEKQEVLGLFPSVAAGGKFTILYDTFFSLDANDTTSAVCEKFIQIKVNRGFKRLIEFDSSTAGNFSVIKNAIFCCCYSADDNDASSPNAPRVSIQSRVAFKDV